MMSFQWLRQLASSPHPLLLSLLTATLSMPCAHYSPTLECMLWPWSLRQLWVPMTPWSMKLRWTHLISTQDNQQGCTCPILHMAARAVRGCIWTTAHPRMKTQVRVQCPISIQNDTKRLKENLKMELQNNATLSTNTNYPVPKNIKWDHRGTVRLIC